MRNASIHSIRKSVPPSSAASVAACEIVLHARAWHGVVGGPEERLVRAIRKPVDVLRAEQLAPGVRENPGSKAATSAFGGRQRRRGRRSTIRSGHFVAE
ncbi:hypothetical protein [Caballeronia calidae]|uniref:hypothetical protein n=1 Tax=Caballeronia calidae TaxID=1777139 RepID=UPI001E47612C|nr:hypothetical protein [Caballeronia calidae]